MADTPPTCYEYRIETVDAGIVSAKPKMDVGQLNHLGSEGWELTGVTTLSDATTTFYFKRPVQE